MALVEKLRGLEIEMGDEEEDRKVFSYPSHLLDISTIEVFI